jgi:hypothetical protein
MPNSVPDLLERATTFSKLANRKYCDDVLESIQTP